MKTYRTTTLKVTKDSMRDLFTGGNPNVKVNIFTEGSIHTKRHITVTTYTKKGDWTHVAEWERSDIDQRLADECSNQEWGAEHVDEVIYGDGTYLIRVTVPTDTRGA